MHTSIISTYVAYLQGRVLGGLLLHHLSEQVYTHSSDFFIMGGAQHQHWHQHQHSMSDGVHIRWKALDLFCHTPQIKSGELCLMYIQNCLVD